MAVTVAEEFSSRTIQAGDAWTEERIYVLMATGEDEENEVAVQSALDTESPEAIDSPVTPGEGITWYRGGRNVEHLGGGFWLGRVEYAASSWSLAETGDVREEFDTTGATTHISVGIAHVASYAPPGEQPPEHQGAINVTPDNDVKGVDITIPVFKWSEVHYLSNGTVTEAFKGKLTRLTGHVNNTPFRGKAAGEVLYMGTRGGQRGSSDWELTYFFAHSYNLHNVTLAGIQGISALGWHYKWWEFGIDKDNNAKRLVTKPIAYHVEQVYRFADFALLGIGTDPL